MTGSRSDGQAALFTSFLGNLHTRHTRQCQSFLWIDNQPTERMKRLPNPSIHRQEGPGSTSSRWGLW